MHHRRAALFLSLWLAAAGPSFAQPVNIEEMTWTELRDRIAGGATTVLVPIGGTEQNGPHMAIGKHNVRARVLADEIAKRLGNAVVAPVVSYVPDEGHMKYPGTVSVPDVAFMSVIEGAARSFRRHGFRDIVLLGDHGGYQRDLKQVATRLNREWKGSPVRVHVPAGYYRETPHAGPADTSLAMAVDKSLVRNDTLARAAPDKDGVRGDPRRANIEDGQRAMREIVETSVAEIQQLARAAR